MAITTAPKALSYFESCIYLDIKNDEEKLESMFTGLFVVARRYLGYSPRGSSAPFITRKFDNLKNSVHERHDHEFATKNHIMLAASIKQTIKQFDMSLAISSSAIQKSISALITANYGDNTTNVPLSGYRVTQIFLHLILDYWDDMLAYASQNQHYQKKWQSIGCEIRSEKAA